MAFILILLKIYLLSFNVYDGNRNANNSQHEENKVNNMNYSISENMTLS